MSEATSVWTQMAPMNGDACHHGAEHYQEKLYEGV